MSTQELFDQNKEKFSSLWAEYSKFNSQVNISAIREEEDFYSKHIKDALEVIPFLIREGQELKVLDIGTGGGFPALPLAIALPDLKILAMDSVAKKIKFVELAKEKFALANLEAVTSRAEDLGQDKNYRGSFDVVLSRAVAKMPVLLEYAIPFLKTGGLFIAFKNKDLKEELSSAANALKILAAANEGNFVYEDKQLIFFRKMAETDIKYPRITGKALKAPL